jgi:teichuronic acid biosynthesis glycosyltransferase TuaC
MANPAGSHPPLHVLTLTPFFPSQQNEISGCYVAEPIEPLRQFGVDCSVIAVSPIHYSRKHPLASAPADWVRYPQLPGTLGLSSAGKLLYARLLAPMRRLHRAHPIDVIHAHAALPCGHAAMLLSRRLDIPFVVTVHGLDVFNSCYLTGTPAAWRKNVSLRIYRSARTVICISGKVEALLKSAAPPEISTTIVPNGVNPTLFSPTPAAIEPTPHPSAHPSNDPEILVVGMLLPSKGHELVLRALATLRSSFPRLRCRIVGEGPNRSQFLALARELGIASQIDFVPRLTRSQVAEAMRRCSIFALPSSNEALGCVYLEAMSCAKPVIACHGQGIDEVIEHGKNGWLIPSNSADSEQLARAFSTLLASPELHLRIGQTARQTILEKLTLSHQAAHLAEIYRRAALATRAIHSSQPATG